MKRISIPHTRTAAFVFLSASLFPLTAHSQNATVVEVDPIAGPLLPLVQVCTGIAPTNGSLPKFTIDGNAADVFPVSYTHTGKVDWVQIVGPSSGGTTAILDVDPTAAVPVNSSYNTIDLTGIEVHIAMPNVLQTATAPLVDSTPFKVLRDGKWIREEEYFTRFEYSNGGVDYTLAGLRAFITRRSDSSSIEVTVVLHNDIFDPEDPAGAWSVHPEVDGDILFNRIWIDSLPAGYEIVAESDSTTGLVQDPSQNLPAGELIKQDPSGDCQRWPGGLTIVRQFVLAKTSDAAEAGDIAAMKGYGYASNGDYSVHERRGFGAQRDFVAPLGIEYEGTSGGPSGRDLAVARDEEWYNEVTGFLQSGGTADCNYWESGQAALGNFAGFFFPGGPLTPSATSHLGIRLRDGVHMSRLGWLAKRHQLLYALLRNPICITTPTGEMVTQNSIVAAHGNQNLYPYAWHLGYDPTRRFAHFIGAEVTGGTQLKPSTRPWNSPGTSAVLQTDYVFPFKKHGEFGPYPSSHSARFSHLTQALTWGCNLGWAKFFCRNQGAWAERGLPDEAADDSVIPSNYNFPKDGNNLANIVANVASDMRPQWGGYQKSGAFLLEFSRGHGHLVNSIAEAARITDPTDPWRANDLEEWGESMALCLDAVLSPIGSGARTVIGDELNHPSDPNEWGVHDVILEEGAICEAWSSGQTYQQGFLAWGFLGLEVALRPRPTGTTGVLSERNIIGLARMLWESADARGADKANAYYFGSTTFDTFADAPAGFQAWDGRPATFLKDWTLPATSLVGNFNGVAGRRDLIHLYCAYRLSKKLGYSDADDFIDWSLQLLDISYNPADPINVRKLQLANELESQMGDEVTETEWTRGDTNYMLPFLSELRSEL